MHDISLNIIYCDQSISRYFLELFVLEKLTILIYMFMLPNLETLVLLLSSGQASWYRIISEWDFKSTFLLWKTLENPVIHSEFDSHRSTITLNWRTKQLPTKQRILIWAVNMRFIFLLWSCQDTGDHQQAGCELVIKFEHPVVNGNLVKLEEAAGGIRYDIQQVRHQDCFTSISIYYQE